MGKKIDLTGQRFGRLVVVEKSGRLHGRTAWLCKCDCGNEKKIGQSNLRQERTRSCGCLKKESVSKLFKKDITNKRFGKLVAIKDSGTKLGGKTRWICKCDCGNESIVTIDNLTSGHVSSCGCYQKELLSERTPRIHKKMIKRKYGKSLVEGTSLPSLTSKIYINNKSGVKGVSFDRNSNRWVANIGLKGEVKRLGSFHNKQDAINVRKEAEDKYFNPILDKYAHESK